ncbi:MAG: DUF2214 family protein [Verrucomicrobiota bacterium]
MATEILIRYIHFLSIFALVAVVFGQHFWVKGQMSREQIGRLQLLDIVYAVSAVVVLATGFLQWLAVGKPADFYGKNWIFHTKILGFLVIGLLSIYPSVFLGKQRKGEPSEVVAVPSLVIWTIRAELVLLFMLPVLATMMARGIGL